MRRGMSGFGMVEVMLALLLGLIVSLGLTQVFISSKSTYLSQASSAALQEDARFVLAKMTQEVRLAGMFGCLGHIDDKSLDGRFSSVRRQALRWNPRQQSLTLISAAPGSNTSWHEWVVHTDCVSSATAWSRGRAPALHAGYFALAIEQHLYRFNPRSGELTLNGQPLLSNVRAFSVLFGVASAAGASGVARYTSQPDPALVRSVRLSLTLFDPADRAREQTFHMVAAIRNRLG